MRKIAATSALSVYLDHVEYTEAALAAAEETADLALAFGEALTAWDAIAQRERAGRRAIVRADAAVAVADQALDEATMRFSIVLLAETKGDRKAALFRRFFPAAASEFIRKGLRKQCEETRDRLVAELGRLDPASPLRAHASVLEAASSAALAALDARAKVRAERASIASDVTDWKDGINKLRTTTYAELLKLSVEASHTRGWADAFFYAAASESETEPEADAAPGPSA